MLTIQDDKFKNRLAEAVQLCLEASMVGSTYMREEFTYGPYKVKVYLVGRLVRVDVSYAV